VSSAHYISLALSASYISTLSLPDALPIFDARHAVLACQPDRPVRHHILAGGVNAEVTQPDPLDDPVSERDTALYEYFVERGIARSEEHTSELQSRENVVCRLLLATNK